MGPFGCPLVPLGALFGTLGDLLNPMLVAVGLAPAIAAVYIHTYTDVTRISHEEPYLNSTALIRIDA